MKILLLLVSLNRYSKWLSSHRHLISLKNALENLDSEIKCILLGYEDLIYFNKQTEIDKILYYILSNYIKKFWYIRKIKTITGFFEYTKLTKWFTKNKIDVIITSWAIPYLHEFKRKYNFKLILWDVESPHFTQGKFWEEFAKESDLILTYALKGEKYWRERNITCRIEFFPHCYDPKYFYKINIKKRYDLSFIGSYSHRKKEIKKFLYPLIQLYKYKILVAGPGWEKSEIANKIRKIKFIPWINLNYYYNLTKINLNIHTLNQRKMGILNNKIFEVLASQSFLISDYVYGIEQFFENKKDFIYVNNPKEYIELTLYYLENEEERKKIIKKGYEKVFSQHTIYNRAKKIIKLIKKHV